MTRLYKILRLIIVLLLAALALLIAASNTETVSVSLFPLPYELMMPKYLLMLAMLILGVAMGWLTTFSHTLRWRARWREQSRRTDALHNELSTLKLERLPEPRKHA